MTERVGVMSARVPIIWAAGEGEKWTFLGGGLHTWKLTTDDTDGAFFMFEDVMGPGKCTPLHRHPEADETVYVLEGEIVVNVDGKESRVSAGGMTFTPRGVPHAFLVGSAVCRILTLQTPGIGQAFYRGASEPAIDDAFEAVDIARLQTSAQENPRGIEILGPPPFATLKAG
jgi:quercetin dioxygenase-like cupin family protein